MNYKIVRSRAGKVSVKYECPNCKEALESQITEAGQSDFCPACKVAFTVPGEPERKQLEEKLRKDLQERKAKELERKSQEEAERLVKEAQAAEATKARLAEKTLNENLVERNRNSDGHQSIRYPALEFYIFWMQSVGLLCFIAAWFTLAFFVIGFLIAIVFANDGGAMAVRLFALLPIMLSLAAAGFSFRFASELVKLALDTRLDIAKLVNLRSQAEKP